MLQEENKKVEMQRSAQQAPMQVPMQFMPQSQMVYGDGGGAGSMGPAPQANQGYGAQTMQQMHFGGVAQHAGASGKTDPYNNTSSFESKMAHSSLKVGEPAYLGWSNVSFTLAPKVVAKSGKDPRYSHYSEHD